jgi:hypothetical protein
VHDALNTVRSELEFTGRSHLELAALIRSELEQATIEFLAVQKEQRKSVSVPISCIFNRVIE